MPKIIENLEARMIDEAKRQIEAQGYGAMTIRSVASGCGVGVGTVYNYFPSKDALVATYMLEDWKTCIAEVEAVSAESQDPAPVVQSICLQLRRYVARHQAVFQDEAARAAFAGSISRYHALLRQQLAAPLRRFCSDAFTPQFIAEALLTWTMAGKTFDEIYGIVSKLF